MTREEVLKSPDYWKSRIQIALYNCADFFMKKTNRNRKQLAEYLGVSGGYVTQLLNGDYDHKLSKLTELSLAFGFVPHMEFIPVDKFIGLEKFNVDFNHLIGKNHYSFQRQEYSCSIALENMKEDWNTEEKIQKGAA